MSAPGSGYAGVTVGAYVTDDGPRVRIKTPNKWIDLSTEDTIRYAERLVETAAVAERLHAAPVFVRCAPGKGSECRSN